MPSHTSVLLEEALHWLDLSPGKTIIDGTLGLGGHAGRILERLGPDGKLYGFDKDPDALEIARENLKEYGDRAMLFHDDFKDIAARMNTLGVKSADGVLLDLGVSSMQLDRPERGFSFRGDGPLDMRMNPGQDLTAKTIVNDYPKEEIMNILWKFGEERFARRIAERIDAERSRRSIDTTAQLASVVSQAVPSSYRYGRIHPATRTFQALRIVVNDEVDALQEFLSHATEYLGDGGKIVVISFHSLEDRAVKWSFRDLHKNKRGTILTKKPVEASEAEAASNPRSRSAKLRAFVKTGEAA
jgi:16S rRNA (cytosine1402-N4)-methyltransferase